MNLAPVVVLPVTPPDFHLALKWVRWAKALGATPKGGSAYILRLLIAASVPIDEREKIVAEVRSEPSWGYWQMDLPVERPDLGYAYAANMMFRAALECVESEFPGGRPMLWCEADTVPTRPSWFSEIAAEYESCGKPFMGAFHPHGDIPHMSGNAVYPANWRTLAPSLAALPGPNPGQGWDSSCAHETVPQMHVARTIQQVWIMPPVAEHNIDRFLKPETALFHRTKDGTMIDVLAKRQGIKAIELTAPIAGPTSTVDHRGLRQAAMPRVEILIVTFARDMEFLRYCLRSIRQYASGFYGTTIVVPSHEVGLYDWVKREARIRYFDEPEGKGMMAHEIQKCRADEWRPAADFILHLDADCMFFRRVTPADYVKEWRALMVGEPYAKITNPNRHIWKKCVKDATGYEPTHDCMVRHPQIHPRQAYKATREAVEAFTGKPFNEYVLGCKNDFPQGFAEYPTIATIGLRQFRPWYNFVEHDHADDVKLTGQPAGSFQYAYRRDKDHLVEWWSHGGIARYKSDCDAVMAGRIPAYFIK